MHHAHLQELGVQHLPHLEVSCTSLRSTGYDILAPVYHTQADVTQPNGVERLLARGVMRKDSSLRPRSHVATGRNT